ncbi:dihydropteroate synthase [Mailhella massiliensis]|uniref:Dihydropteroate synthase n=1 Tax=Mailhella massiliensis TaxID=1903261 RepID=A0A921DS52_9BACT|nr:dihydropteroate synthase [Mailhella massiliensis]HJD98179.1 dihydropteroate synthase [Mailhella massiliensis]
MTPVWMLRHGAFSPVSSEKQGGTPSRFTLWGVVNVTPDSFYDGGRHAEKSRALSHALTLAGEGARILDFGGASSRPGAEDVPAKEELSRVMPVLREACLLRASGEDAFRERLFSVDTWRAAVAKEALEAGADIVNDISACAWEPELREVVASCRPGYVLMHCLPGARPGSMQKAPHYGNVTDEVLAFFEEGMKKLVGDGLPEEHIMLDPGIGFGKTAEHNSALLCDMERLLALGRPVLLGVSQKSLFGDILGLDVAHRGEATNVCTALLAARGVRHHRVHDVASARRALTLADRFTPWGD